MPSLNNIDGRSLVGSTDTLNNILLNAFGTKRQRDAEQVKTQQQAEIQEQIGILTDSQSDLPPGTIDESGAIQKNSRSAKQKEAALVRLSALNPQVANAVRQSLERGDKQAAQQIAAETEKGVRTAAFIQKQPDFVSKQRAISQAAQEASSKGEDVSRFVDLANKSEEQLDLELQKMLIQGADLKTLTDDALNPAGEEGFTLSQGQTRFGPDGKPIASVKSEAKTTLLKNMEAAGIDPSSAEGKRIIRRSFEKTGVTVKVNNGAKALPFKIPPGFMLVDENNANLGVKPIPGSKGDQLSVESASKVQMIKTGQLAAKGARKLIFDKDGSLNRKNLLAAEYNVPFTEGRKLRTQMEFGIQGITRAETGAAMPPTEVENTRLRFMPKAGDTEDIARIKMEMFDDFMGGAIDLVDPTGSLDDNGKPAPSFNDEAFERELEARSVLPPDGEDAAVFTGQKTPEGYKIFKRPDGSTFAVAE